MKKIDKLIEETLKELSYFCVKECKSFCCRNGFLILNQKELDFLCGFKKEKLISEAKIQEKMFGKYLLNLNNSLGGCPQLKNFKCLIHKRPDRPKTCKEFPIFVLDNKIKISSRCLAKSENKFFKFEIEAKKLGFEIVENLLD